MSNGIIKENNLFKYLLWTGIFFISIVIPILLILQLTFRLPFGDTWNAFIPLYFNYLHHQSYFHEWIARNNEHRVLLTRIVFFIHFLFFPKARFFVTGTSFLLFFAFYILLVQSYKKTTRFFHTHLPKINLWIYFVLACFVFSAESVSFWRWPFIIQFPLTLFFLGWCIFSLSKEHVSWLRLFGCIILSLLSTYSSANGLMIWPIGFLLLLGYRADWMKIVFYCLIGLATIGIYTHGNHPQGLVLNEPIKSFIYFITFFGNEFPHFLAPALGMIALILFCICLIKIYKQCTIEQKYSLYPWIGLGLFSIANGFVGAFTRVQFGIEQSLSSRYACLSYVLLTSVAVFLAVLWPTFKPKWQFRMKCFFIVFSVFYLGKYVTLAKNIFEDYHFSPQEIALPYNVFLPNDKSIYPPGSYHIAQLFIQYKNSNLNILRSPKPNYLGKILSVSEEKKLGKIVILGKYSIFLDKASQKKYPPMIVGVGLQGTMQINSHDNLSNSMLLLDKNKKVVGIAFIAIPLVKTNSDKKVRFFGFEIGNQSIQNLIRLNNVSQVNQDVDRQVF